MKKNKIQNNYNKKNNQNLRVNNINQVNNINDLENFVQNNNNFNFNNNIIEDNNNNINFNNFNFAQNDYDIQNVRNEQMEELNDINNNEEESEEDENEKEINKKKCSTNGHKEIDAIIYCQECKNNMCEKCEKIHTNTILLKNHHTYSLDKNPKDIFTGLCLKPEHALALKYYCETHNELCCAACIAKIKKKGDGKHKDCVVYYISKIKPNKKKNLENNMKKLEELSKELEPSIKELKSIYEKINESKDEIKKEIQLVFCKIRTELNNREDKLYLKIDQKFDDLFFKEKFIKESEKLPKLVKNLLDKGKIEEKEWEDKTKLSKLINECINIEDAIKDINTIYDKIKTFNDKKEIKFEFIPKDNEIQKGLLKEVKNFGNVKIFYNKKKEIEQELNINNNNNINNQDQIELNQEDNQEELLMNKKNSDDENNNGFDFGF